MKKFLSLFLSLALALVGLALPAAAESTVFAFDRSVTSLFEGATLATALKRAGDAQTGDVTYVSSSEKNASVDQNGVVTGILKGRTTITATLKTDKGRYRATTTLTILRKVAAIALDETKLSVYAPGDATITPLLAQPAVNPTIVVSMGTQVSLPLSAMPADADNRKLTVASSDETVVQVRGYTLRPYKTGECDVTVSSVQNPEIVSVYHVLVVQPIAKITLSAPDSSLYVGSALTLTPAYSPSNATIQAVTWQSLNEKVATVDQNGTVTGTGRGSAVIKATAADGSGRSGSYTVRVQQQPTAIVLKESDVTVNMGVSKTLSASVQPGNADDRRVVWASSDETIATVSATGRVTPVAPGACVVTCSSAAFPEVKAAANVTVHQLVTGVAFTEKSVTFNVNTTVKVFWQAAPSNATDPSVTLASSNEKIATVDQDGTIHGLKRGTCKVTATANDGSRKRGTITVNVLQPVEGVHMANETIRVGVDETTYARAILEPADASNTHMSWVSADTSIATVSGSRTKPAVTGVKWGDTTITGTTEDGGYTVTATVKVGNYDRAAVITDLYLEGDLIKIGIKNASNMNLTRIDYTIACYDIHDQPLACNTDGSNSFTGTYARTLYAGETTAHGRFTFTNFVQPAGIGRVVMTLTGYKTDEGYSRSIKTEKQQVVEYKSAAWVGPVTP